ncbi:MAG TPA: hypothetical protein ENJ52_04345 [Aliiroseovarius sp.]|nr:hypothetical protein [Aliiroseovarius sp.]
MTSWKEWVNGPGRMALRVVFHFARAEQTQHERVHQHMTESNAHGEENTAEQAFRVVSDHVLRAIFALDEKIRAMEADKDRQPGDMVREIAETRKAIQVFYEERTRFEKFCEKTGIGGAGGLDLDGARDEIRRRLDCLRRSRNPEGVSGQPE